MTPISSVRLPISVTVSAIDLTSASARAARRTSTHIDPEVCAAEDHQEISLAKSDVIGDRFSPLRWINELRRLIRTAIRSRDEANGVLVQERFQDFWLVQPGDKTTPTRFHPRQTVLCRQLDGFLGERHRISRHPSQNECLMPQLLLPKCALNARTPDSLLAIPSFLRRSSS